MAIQFVFGSAGSGKSRFVNQELLDLSKENPGKNYFLVVPEQFTMETQKELVGMHPGNSIMHIDILSFQRLAYRIFDELGIQTERILEDTGKNLILKKVAEENNEKLTFLKNNLSRPGYINEMKSLLSELMQYHITPEMLELEIHHTENNVMRSKLTDILIMYRGFHQEIHGRFITAEDVLPLLSDVVGESERLRNAVIVFDGFTGFTPVQMLVVESLMKQCSRLIFTVTLGKGENPYHSKGIHELFYLSRQLIKGLMNLADQSGTDVLDPVMMSDQTASRFGSESTLSFLEQNLFRPGNKVWDTDQTPSDIQLFSLQNPKEELEFIAESIQKDIRRKDLRYLDIAVVCADLAVYSPYLNEVFEKYEIPYFLDQTKSILDHPFVECLRSILEVIYKDFSYESIFRYLRSGFSTLKMEETDVLENYILAAGIRGSRVWRKDFTYQMKGMEEAELEEINRTRKSVFAQFDQLLSLKNQVDVLSISKELYHFLCHIKAQEQLEIRQEKAKSEFKLRQAREYSQIYKIVIDLLDKTVELLGNERMTLEEFSKLLDAGFEAEKIGSIPPGMDHIVVGDMERTRLDHIKVLYFCGINDTNIPQKGSGDGLLTQQERELLDADKIILAPTSREKMFIQRFYIYLLLCKPSLQLNLTFSRVNTQGKAVRISYLIHTVRKLFPKLGIQEIREVKEDNIPLTGQGSLEMFAKGINMLADGRDREVHERFLASLYAWLCSSEELSGPAGQIFDAAFLQYHGKSISKEVAHLLYGEVLENSVTRLERFAACAFSHYLSYGLSLRERQLHQFEAVDMGNLFHDVLDIYAKEIKRNHLSWFDIDSQQSEILLRGAIEEAFLKNANLALYDDARSLYMKERMTRILRRTVWAITLQIRQGNFIPEEFETSFQQEDQLDAVRFTLSDEEKMFLRGRIDRIDTFVDPSNVYVKVIDYKSGQTSFQFLNIYYGLSLQLVIYMNAALEIMEKRFTDKKVEPAGIFYSYMKDPVINLEHEISEEELTARIFKEFKLNGIVNSNREIYEKLDHSLVDTVSVSSDMIPIGINKDGSLKKGSKACSTHEFTILSGYVNKMAESLGQRILDGDIQIAPYQMSDKEACDYCDFRSICQFDIKIPGYEYRKLKNISDDDILAKMSHEVEELTATPECNSEEIQDGI
ncbi:MAG: helicase-exonuclease AddAB subunit AddB [Lachnospiraceae bacterium]